MLKKHLLKYVFGYNRWLYAAICAMLFIMSMLFFSLSMMNGSYSLLQQKYEVDYNQEDFQFIPSLTSSDVISERIIELEKKYDFIAEEQRYKLVEEHQIIYKVIGNTKEINKHYIIEGRSPTEADEVVIDIKSAEYLGKNVGDVVSLHHASYVISGIASFPGQLQPNMSLMGYRLYNVNKSVLLSFSNETYDQLPYAEKMFFVGNWNAAEQVLDYIDFTSVIELNNNAEANTLNSKYDMNQMIAGLSTGVLSSIIILMLLMLVYKMVKDNEPYFGIFKGIGYTNGQLMVSFIPLLLTFVLPVILGYSVSLILQEPLFRFMNQDMIVPYSRYAHSWLLAIMTIVVFSVFIISIAMVLLVFMLRKSPLHMIIGTTSSKLGKLKRACLNIFNSIKGIRKLQLKFLLGQTFVLVLTLFTGFAIGVQLLLAFAIYEFPSKLTDGFQKQTNYQYDIRLNDPIEIVDTDKLIGYNVRSGNFHINEQEHQVDIVIIESPQEQQLLSLKLYKNGAHVNGLLNHGVAISKWFANKHDIKLGDTVKFGRDNANYEVVVSVIHQGLQGDGLYTSKSYYEKMTNEVLIGSDGILTVNNEWRNREDLLVKSIINQQDIIDSAQNSVAQYKWMSVFLLIIGVIIGAILFSIALYIVLQNGQKQILLLKALGYSNKQVYTITIEGYLVVLLFGFTVARPYLSMLSIFLFDMLSKESPFYLPINNTALQITMIALFLILFFYGISLVYSRNIVKSKTYLLNE